MSDSFEISGCENPQSRRIEAVSQLLFNELRQSTRASEQNCRDVAVRLANQVARICERSSRIQSSGDFDSWAYTLAEFNLKKVLCYYKLGSKRGRVELHSNLSVMIYRHISPSQDQLSFSARYNMIEDFLQEFYAEALNAFRRENSIDASYRMRSPLEVAEYMAFIERYSKRRIRLPGDRSQQLIILRAQTFSQQQPPEILVDMEAVERGSSDFESNSLQIELDKLSLQGSYSSSTTIQGLNDVDINVVNVVKTTVAYKVLLSVSSEEVLVGSELETAIYLCPAGIITRNAYLLEVQYDEAVGGELSIFLNAPGFQFNSENATSLPLDPDAGGEVFPQQPTQTAYFRLTALRPGVAKIKAELYCGKTFKTVLETNVQVASPEEALFSQRLDAARSRPVPQPDLILQVRTAWNNDTSAFTFRYHTDTFQPRLLFADDSDYCSESLPAGWVERCLATSRSASTHLLLKTTLEDAASSLPEDFRSRLASLGQYLFQRLLPAELQSIFRSIAGFNRPFTLLILADQDAWIPWELLHDGQTFLGERFIIGRWLWELDKARPYEFPVGAVNVAHYASVEQPEVWTGLLEPPGAPPPIPLLGGVLADLSSTESMRGLHLIRFGQSSDTANRRDAPVLVNGGSGNLDIEREVQPAKLSLRRNRPLVTLGYVSAGQPELTALEYSWASTFVRAGCSAFVGSLWAVQPDVEAAFVSGFYHNLWAGQSLGMAFQAARRLARVVAPESLDWLAYVLFGDPMARPYRPVEGQGYAVVEPIGQEIDDPVPPGATVRFRVSLRRTPPVWYENRLMEVAENLAFEDLQVFIVTSGLQVSPADSVEMRRTPTGDYLGWFSLSVPQQMESQSVLVQVFFEDGMEPVHSLRFQVLVSNRDGEGR